MVLGKGDSMAKDDYFVIVYQLLKYLYDCLKTGVRPNTEKLTSQYYRVNERYWTYIMTSLLDDNFVKGVKFINTKDGIIVNDISAIMITPKGIQYLFENSLFEKVKKTLKEVKDIVPGI